MKKGGNQRKLTDQNVLMPVIAQEIWHGLLVERRQKLTMNGLKQIPPIKQRRKVNTSSY